MPCYSASDKHKLFFLFYTTSNTLTSASKIMKITSTLFVKMNITIVNDVICDAFLLQGEREI